MDVLIAEKMFSQVAPTLKLALAELEKSVPPPQKQKASKRWRYRYAEQSIQQAIVIKLARLCSLLHAAWTLAKHGHAVEASALNRMIDECKTDIEFLSGPLLGKLKTADHERFLSDFFQEEFSDIEDILGSQLKRNRVPRKKINAYVAREYSADGNYSQTIDVLNLIEKAYSGYIHGAAAHVMDLYDPRLGFRVSDVAGTWRQAAVCKDLLNYLYRASMVFCIAALALGNVDIHNRLYSFSNELGEVFNLNGGKPNPF